MIQVIAQRGLAVRCPENTLLAFERAFALGVDGVSLDLRRSADGALVVFRDESLRRVTGVDLPVGELTVRELKTLDASLHFHNQCPVQRIPLFEEYCALVRKKSVLTLIELQTLEDEMPGIERAMVELIDAFRLNDRVIVCSRNHDSLTRVAALAPDLPRGALYTCRLSEPQEYAKARGMQYLLPNHRFLADADYQKYEAAGVKTIPWGAENDKDLGALMDKRNVTAVLTANPAVAMALQNRK